MMSDRLPCFGHHASVMCSKFQTIFGSFSKNCWLIDSSQLRFPSLFLWASVKFHLMLLKFIFLPLSLNIILLDLMFTTICWALRVKNFTNITFSSLLHQFCGSVTPILFVCLIYFYFWLYRVFTASFPGAFSSCSKQGLLSLRSMGFRHGGFSSWGWGAVERGLCSCDAWA